MNAVMTAQELIALHRRITRPRLDPDQRALLRFIGNAVKTLLLALTLAALAVLALALLLAGPEPVPPGLML
jgi:hypothetical protein